MEGSQINKINNMSDDPALPLLNIYSRQLKLDLTKVTTPFLCIVYTDNCWPSQIRHYFVNKEMKHS